MNEQPSRPRPTLKDVLVPNATVFLASACIMIVELVAGRIISRHLGQSLYTWTSVIGIVLAGISLGNYTGGRIADRFEAGRALSVLFVLSSLSCLTVPVLNNLVGQWGWLWERSWPTRILIHVFLTFIFPSTMLGTISPVVAKMALSRGFQTGRTIGDVYAWGAVGSIAGTFLAGFYLIAVMGSVAVVVTVAVVLALIGLAYGVRFWLPYFWGAACLVAAFAAMAPNNAAAALGRALLLREPADPYRIYERESQYSYIAVKVNPENPDERGLYLDKLEHSIVNIKEPLKLKYGYHWIYEGVLGTLTPTGMPVTALVIGGGGHAFSQYLELSRPGSHIEVAEIDPAVTRAAYEAFGLRSNTTIRTYNMDARNYVAGLLRRQSRGEPVPRYNYVFGDVVNDFSVPYQLTTVEFDRQVMSLLADDGVYLLNVIDIFDTGRLLGGVVNAFKEVFPHVSLFSCSGNLSTRDTFVVIGSKRALDLSGVTPRIQAIHGFTGFLVPETKVAELESRTRGLVLTDDYAPVENLLAAVVRQDRGDVLEKYMQAGAAAAGQGDFDRAIREFRAAIRLNPSFGRGYYNLGVAYSQKGSPQEALDAFAAAVQLDPNNVDARNNAALILARGGMIDEAITQWQEVLRVRPDSADANNNLGNALAQKGRLDEAMACWTRALQINPGSASAHNNLGNAFMSKGQVAEAIANYRAAIQLKPDLAEAHNNLGDILAAQGNVAEAVEHFKEAVRLNPGLVQAQRSLQKWGGGQ